MPFEVIRKMDLFTKSYEKRRLTAEEFANRGKDILDKGGTFDFSEFELVREGKPGPFFKKFVDRMKKYGPKDNFILTARPLESAPHIQMWLKMEGYDIPIKNITALGNSTAEAKALWMLKKVEEGYNDFFFADDAIKNVKEVDNVLSQVDVKYNVQQAKAKATKGIDGEFNKIIEESANVKAEKTFSAVSARMLGADKGKYKLFVPPSAEDFVGLLYSFLGRGKQGEKHLKFFDKTLLKPYAKAYNDIHAAKQSIGENLLNNYLKR